MEPAKVTEWVRGMEVVVKLGSKARRERGWIWTTAGGKTTNEVMAGVGKG